MTLEETRPQGHDRARGIVSNRASGSRIEVRTFAPSEALGLVVSNYWSSRWDLCPDAPHTVELLSDPCVNLAFENGAGRLVGLSTHLWRRELVGRGCVRAVKFRAGALRAVAPKVAAHTLADRVVAWREVFSDAPSDFEVQILSAPDDAEAAQRLDAWLTARVARALRPDVALVVKVIERVTDDPTITSVRQMATLAGVAVRSLQELFRTHVGASPKWLIRRVRLQEAARRIERGELANLAALAAELGYSDHAHLSRDFKAATGRTPTAFAREVWR